MRTGSMLLLAGMMGLALGGAAVAQRAEPALPRPVAAKAVDPALARALADARRDGDRARDSWRRPGETLAFFGVTPTMKVGEYAPGGEWYSRLLGLYLGPRGQLVGLYFNPQSGAFPAADRQQAIRKAATEYPSDIAKWSGIPADRFTAFTLDQVPADQKGTFDRILVMRMMHNLMRWNIADSELKAMRALLKPGGMLGIEQHRARPDAPYDYADGSKGYLREADVIRFVEAHGFTLVGRSEANANSGDPANHAQGVWEMPPTLATKRDDLKNLGESDRMTLLFRKR